MRVGVPLLLNTLREYSFGDVITIKLREKPHQTISHARGGVVVDVRVEYYPERTERTRVPLALVSLECRVQAIRELADDGDGPSVPWRLGGPASSAGK